MPCLCLRKALRSSDEEKSRCQNAEQGTECFSHVRLGLDFCVGLPRRVKLRKHVCAEALCNEPRHLRTSTLASWTAV